MSSKIPRLLSPPGTAKTDDEKLSHLFRGARPKQTAAVKSSENLKTNRNLDPTNKKSIKICLSKVMNNKIDPPSGMSIPKSTINRTYKNTDFSKKENVKKGCVSVLENIKTMKLSENKISYGSCKDNQNQLPLKNKKSESYRKTEFKNRNPTNESDKDLEFAGLILIPKVRRSYKSPLDFNKSRRRSLSEPNIKPGNPSEKGKGKIIGNQILHTNKSKTINRRELDITYIMSSKVSDSMKSNLAQHNVAQKEFLASSKDVAHGGLKFLPNLKKKKPGFNFNVNKS